MGVFSSLTVRLRFGNTWGELRKELIQAQLSVQGPQNERKYKVQARNGDADVEIGCAMGGWGWGELRD